ncbi:MAG TPA: cytochrome b/b6 domain-containing protein [Pseudomonadales bacterium]
MSYSWRSWLGVLAVLFGLLAAAQHATELTRHAVMIAATPSGPLPAAECPADELAEEGLSVAECQQMVDNVGNYTLSAPDWFAMSGIVLGAAGTLVALWTVIAGAALLDHRGWSTRAAAVGFAGLALIDAAGFVAAQSAGPILRDLYLWDHLLWFALHLALLTATLAGRESDPQLLSSAAGDLPTARPFGRVATVCHFVLAASIFFLFASSWWMLALPLPSEEFRYRAFPFQLHKNIGLTLVVVLGALLISRFRRPPQPPAHERLPVTTHRVAMVAHALLYLAILAVIWSGYMSSSYSGWSTTFWWVVDLPHWGREDEELNVFYSDVHLWTCWALLAVMALHIGGALLHAFKADGFVRRMLRP